MKKTKKSLSILLSLLMVVSALPMTVFANDAVSYISRSWNGSKVVDTTKSVTNYILVTSSTTTFENGKYYVVNSSVTNSNRIVTNGTAHLILTDGCELNVKNGINVPSGAKINIYGQNENTGKISASTANNAAIGGNEDKNGGQIILHGGTYDLTVANAAAIGSARYTSIGNITIYNGNITAKVTASGAGIGTGYEGTATNINIYGGNINASAGSGAAIGSGNYGTVDTINIYDGIISANSTGYGTGVGSGFWGSCGTINVFGGIVNTNLTGLGNSFGAGYNGSVSVINFFGGTVTAKANNNSSKSNAVGANKIFFDINTKAKYGTDEDDIKGELDYTSNDITSSLNNSKYAYIYQEKFVLNPVTYIERNATTSTYKTITDYEVVSPTTEKFENNKYYVVIKNIDISKRIIVSGTAHLILLDGKTFNANLGICIDDGNKLFIYGQCADSGVLNAKTFSDGSSGHNSAIGASKGVDAGDITISGGTIKASASNRFSAAIGGSDWHTNGRIDIYGGVINANGDYGAGIGAGYNADGNPSKAISIYGGTVKASAIEGAGIGAGRARVEGTNSSKHKLVAGHGGLVKIYGGNVTASSSRASAIGGTNYTATYDNDSTKTFYGNPATLYMDPSITLKYGDDKDSATRTLKTTSLTQNVGSVVNRYHYVSYSTGTPEVTHDYAPATCTSPKICNACGKKNGTALGHDFAPATCTAPKTCTGCDLTIGSPLGHNWVVKSCYQPRECANCGEKEDYTYGHDFRPYEKVEDQESYPDTYKAKCVNCGDLIDYMSYKESYSKEEDVNFEDVYEYDTFKPGIKIAPINNGEAGKMVVSIDGVEVETVNADGKFTVPNCTECALKYVDLDGTMYLMLTTICTFTYPTCQNIPECIFCGNTAGKLDGHTWVEATCIEPRKCFFCGETEGEPLGHSYIELGRLISYETCTSPAIYAAECEKCHEENGTIELGEPLGHDYMPVSTSDDELVKTYRCYRCDDSYTVDKTALASIIALANDEYINSDIANKKYTGISRLKFGVLLGTATLDNDSATQSNVDSIATSIQNMINNLELKEYTVKVNKIVNDEVVDTYDATVNYGDMFNYEMLLDENQAIYKWVMETDERDAKLNTITQDLSQVINGNVTFNCYIDNTDTKASDIARVVFYDKTNRVIKLDYVEVGSSVNMSVEAPKVAFYDFIGWETVSGDPSNVDKSGIALRATYAPKNIAANKSTIVALGNVKVNGKQTTTEFYDAKITLTGADSYAYCDAEGNILQGINGNVIYAPNNSQTIYVCAGIATKASTAITGYIDENNKLTINAQYYLPSGSTVVEAGVIATNGDKSNTFKSSQQGSSGEYSISLNYGSASGTLIFKSYLTYKDTDGIHTIYSESQAISFGQNA